MERNDNLLNSVTSSELSVSRQDRGGSVILYGLLRGLIDKNDFWFIVFFVMRSLDCLISV